MNIDFTPRSITCHQTVSSPNAPWGMEDGFRLYFAVEVAFQSPDVMISGRKYPEPDVVDNYPIKAGQTINLDTSPPFDRASWQTKVFNVDEGNLVTVWLIGVNEGLPFFGGGGGSSQFSTKLAHKGGQLLIEKIADEASDEALKRSIAGASEGLIKPVPIVGALASALIELAEYIDESTDCSGSVFIYKKEILGRDLIAQLLQNRRSITLSFNQNQSLRSEAPDNPCLTPSYEATLDINLRSVLKVTPSRTLLKTTTTAPVEFNPLFISCTRKTSEPIQVWSEVRDFRIEFIPNFTFQLMPIIWKIENQILTQQQATATVNLPVTIQPNQQNILADVNIRYEIDLRQHLILYTTGSEGSFQIRVQALLPLQSQQPPFLIYQHILMVDSQDMLGNKGYQEYLDCMGAKLNGLISKIDKTQFVKPRKFLPRQPSKPPVKSRSVRAQKQIAAMGLSDQISVSQTVNVREMEALLGSIETMGRDYDAD